MKGIHYNVLLSVIQTQINKEWKNEWRNRKDRNTICYTINKEWNSKLTKLFKTLNYYQSTVMIRIISEHIEINSYYNKLKCKIELEQITSDKCVYSVMKKKILSMY